MISLIDSVGSKNYVGSSQSLQVFRDSPACQAKPHKARPIAVPKFSPVSEKHDGVSSRYPVRRSGKSVSPPVRIEDQAMAIIPGETACSGISRLKYEKLASPIAQHNR
jgi:hypothetical protein